MFISQNTMFFSNRLFLRKGLDLRCSQSDLSLDLQKKLQEAQIGLDVIQGSHYLKGGSDGIGVILGESKNAKVAHMLFMFTPTWENDPIRQAYFSDGLVQPPPRHGNYESSPLNSAFLCCGNRMTVSCVSKTLKPKNSSFCIRDI